MINVNQLTQQLRMLPDAALQRVAMMYKQDPYIFPMVVSEGMARKKLRAAGQAQAAQGTPPKVNDQAVASLGATPEEMGIGSLQARSLNIPDGGIAGYAEGGVADTAEDAFSQGGMFDFAQRSEPVVRMAEGGVARYADRGLVQTTSDTLAQVQAPVMEELQNLQAQLVEAERVLAAAAKSGDATSATQYARAAQDIRDKMNALANKSFGNRAPQILGDITKPARTAGEVDDAGIYSGLYPKEAPKAPPLPIPDVQIAGQRPPAAPSAPGITPTPAATGPGRAEQLLGKTEGDMMRRLNTLRMEAQQRGDEEQVMFEANKPKGKVAEGLEALLKKQEEAEPKEREQAKAMAIFNAGLAMMAGSSPYALQNIAKGAMAGTTEYAGAMKEFKQAAKERMKLQADIEQARRAEERDDSKTALSLFMRANDRMARIDDHMADAGLKLGLSKAEIAAKMEATSMELGSRERIANAQIRASDPLALFRTLGDGDVKKGYDYAQTAKAEPSLTRQLAVEAVKNPTSLTLLKQQNPELYNAVIAEVRKISGGSGGAPGLDLSQWGSVQKVGG